MKNQPIRLVLYQPLARKVIVFTYDKVSNKCSLYVSILAELKIKTGYNNMNT